MGNGAWFGAGNMDWSYRGREIRERECWCAAWRRNSYSLVRCVDQRLEGRAVMKDGRLNGRGSCAAMWVSPHILYVSNFFH